MPDNNEPDTNFNQFFFFICGLGSGFYAIKEMPQRLRLKVSLSFLFVAVAMWITSGTISTTTHNSSMGNRETAGATAMLGFALGSFGRSIYNFFAAPVQINRGNQNPQPIEQENGQQPDIPN